MSARWRKVVAAADCIDAYGDGEVLLCPRCGTDYAECPCPGPHQDDEYDYEWHLDGLYARLRDGPKVIGPKVPA